MYKSLGCLRSLRCTLSKVVRSAKSGIFRSKSRQPLQILAALPHFITLRLLLWLGTVMSGHEFEL